MDIRLYKNSDFEMIQNWWIDSNEIPPLREMLTEDSTFVLEMHGKARMCITVYLTNCKAVAHLENFVKDPNFKDSNTCSKILVEHAEKFAKEKGYKYLMCLSYQEKLKSRYEKLGYIRTLNNLSSFCKELV